MKNRILILALSTLLLGGIAVGYVITRPGGALSGTADPSEVALRGEGRVLALFNGRLGTARRDGGDQKISAIRCDRSYAAAGTIGCLRPSEENWGQYQLVVLNGQFQETGKPLDVPGLANRLRVSNSGRMVSWTVFVSGEDYTSDVMSTRTGILDTKSGEAIPSLEVFAATINGMPHKAVDDNYWGITFAGDDNRFYVTMFAGGTRYLMEGDLAARTVRNLKSNVECPSLAPDQRRIAFKEAIDGNPKKGWRLSVLELATMKVTHLAETRSVDDQPAWLDNGTVAYNVQRSDGINETYGVPADGSGHPVKLVEGGNSPAPYGL
ncbi:hypothetical protein D5S17_07575 [Pseudonocardiaceae bacterium YIM PH 21723]|nr:hypothetical protein D5S17_07575 [Pseudonocardiaceae bacterium YIM PH 21723]